MLGGGQFHLDYEESQLGKLFVVMAPTSKSHTNSSEAKARFKVSAYIYWAWDHLRQVYGVHELFWLTQPMIHDLKIEVLQHQKFECFYHQSSNQVQKPMEESCWEQGSHHNNRLPSLCLQHNLAYTHTLLLAGAETTITKKFYQHHYHCILGCFSDYKINDTVTG